MREMLFRGKFKGYDESRDDYIWNTKELKKGTWVYGDLLKCGRRCFIAEIIPDFASWDYHTINDEIQLYEVYPVTVGQYTGRIGEGKIQVFEGDVCRFREGKIHHGIWDTEYICAITDMTNSEQARLLNEIEFCTVIGNIYNDPELINNYHFESIKK